MTSPRPAKGAAGSAVSSSHTAECLHYEIDTWFYIDRDWKRFWVLAFVSIVFWVCSGCKQTEENYWVVSFRLPSWLNKCIPLHIEKVMEERAFISQLVLAFQCAGICTSAENKNFAAALNYHNDPQRCA